MKGGDPFGKRELTITDYCSSLKPKATKHETMVKHPFKQFHIFKILYCFHTRPSCFYLLICIFQNTF